MTNSTRFALVFASLFATASFASPVPAPNMTCTVSDPCQYGSGSDLGYCLDRTFYVREEMDANGKSVSSAVVGRDNDNAELEIFRIAAIIPVSWQPTGGTSTIISGSTDEGDTWMQVRSLGRESKFLGQLTMEEDFGFDVECVVTE